MTDMSVPRGGIALARPGATMIVEGLLVANVLRTKSVAVGVADRMRSAAQAMMIVVAAMRSDVAEATTTGELLRLIMTGAGTVATTVVKIGAPMVMAVGPAAAAATALIKGPQKDLAQLFIARCNLSCQAVLLSLPFLSLSVFARL